MSYRIDDFNALTTPATGDLIPIVDISDTVTQSDDGGTTKKITYANFAGGLLAELGITSNATELNLLDGITVLSGSNTGDEPDASATVPGIVELATTAETTTGTDATRAVTPDGLHDMTSLSGAAWMLDEDDMASNSATLVASQQSIKAHVASGTVTMTNKRITKRIVTTTDDATAVIDVDTTDVYELSAVANATEFTLTGTPTDGQTLVVRVKDAGVTKGLTWTGFTEVGVTLPTATTAGKWHYCGFMYNSAASAWHAIAVVEQA